ncbi:MAG: alpha/beta hydrolase family protein [Pseudorhodoplanes sp.]
MAALLLLVASAPAHAQSVGPSGAEEGPYRRQVWRVPSPEPGRLTQAVLYRPPGDGPFRLAVIAHSSTQDAAQRARFPLPGYDAATQWLLARGYAVVLPQRPGHGETGGRYLEDQRGCDDADYRGAGFAVADSIQAAIDFMRKQDFIRKTGVAVFGQSAGGWGALALASRNPRGVDAIVIFAAGRGGRIDNRPGANCAPERLIETARLFGKTARIPLLAIYAQNDSFFSPALSKRLIDAYRAAGGRAEYRLLPSFAEEGHYLFERARGVASWGPVVEDFLARRR